MQIEAELGECDDEHTCEAGLHDLQGSTRHEASAKNILSSLFLEHWSPRCIQ